MKVVSNSTPIISLASTKQVTLFQKLFQKIIIPDAVYNEIKAKKAHGYEEIDSTYFVSRSIKGRKYLGFLLNDLDSGEAETIILAKELKADILIMDEKLGRKIAMNQNLFVIGTLSVLAMAKEKGIVKKVKPFVDELISKGIWYSNRV